MRDYITIPYEDGIMELRQEVEKWGDVLNDVPEKEIEAYKEEQQEMFEKLDSYEERLIENPDAPTDRELLSVWLYNMFWINTSPDCSWLDRDLGLYIAGDDAISEEDLAASIWETIKDHIGGNLGL